MKTNAVRLLDQARVTYELRDYDVDEADLSAETVAAKVGLPPAQVLKTLVVRGTRSGVAFAVLPADAELDLKALARLASDRAMETVPLREVQPLTGYVRGGVTALAAKKSYPVFVEQEVLRHDRVAVSAGVRGTQILLAPADYVRVSGATAGAISRPKR